MSETDVDEYYNRIPDLKKEEFFAASLVVMKDRVLNDLLKLRRHGHGPDFGWVESQPQADPTYQYLGNYMRKRRRCDPKFAVWTKATWCSRFRLSRTPLAIRAGEPLGQRGGASVSAGVFH
ncbi:hypothetical protein MTO96_030241 [Rhipicephalus appendiculatus]